MSATDFGDHVKSSHIPGSRPDRPPEAKLAELDLFLAQLDASAAPTCAAVRTALFPGVCGGSAIDKMPGRRVDVLLALGMVLLGVATFVALIGFIALCDRV
jgi:hypothetical protein